MSASGLLSAAIVGLVIGSFLNVCIHRLPKRESVVSPGSRCPTCGAHLRWSDNLPILSYLLLGGRCRACGHAISATYPLVELATAIIFTLLYASLGWGVLLFARLLFASAMLVLLVVDLQHRLLPNVITIPGMALGIFFSLFDSPGWVASAIGLALGAGLLLGTAELYYRVRGEEGLGMGDVKMLGMVGAFLGWQLMLVTLVVASLMGSMIGVGLIVLDRRNLKFALPFGSFLAVGAILATLVGEDLLHWYLSFY